MANFVCVLTKVAKVVSDSLARERRVMALLSNEFPAYYMRGDISRCHEASRAMTSVPHPKRELMKLCARIGYTPH
jgi:hypothetical protein